MPGQELVRPDENKETNLDGKPSVEIQNRGRWSRLCFGLGYSPGSIGTNTRLNLRASQDRGEGESGKMFAEDTILNEPIRKAIRQRAKRALSKDDLVRAVFDSFRSQEIELRSVSLEDMKAALVEAARSAKEHGPVAA